MEDTMESIAATGLQRILRAVREEIASSYDQAMRITYPTVTGRMATAFEGTIAHRDGEGFLVVTLSTDQFDASRARLFANVSVPSKSFRREWSLPSEWQSKPVRALGEELGKMLVNNWIEPFLLGT
jgi:hypothetical protein